MKKITDIILKKISKHIDKLINQEVGILTWTLGFLGIIAIRLFLDNFIASTGDFSLISANSLHNILFFLLSFLWLLLILSFLLQIKPFKLSNFFFWSIFLIILPPVFDLIKTGGSVFWSGYLINGWRELLVQYSTIFGNLPSGITYFGTRIVFTFAIFAIAVIIYAMSRNWLKAILGAFLAYTSLFAMASFPSLFTFVYYFFTKSRLVSAVNSVDIAQLLLASHPILGLKVNGFLQESLTFHLNLVYFLFVLAVLGGMLLVSNREKFVAIWKNIRLPQLVYHSGLFFVGIGLGYLAYPNNLNLNIFAFLAVAVLLCSIWLAWLASVVTNDIYDFAIDNISNPERPLQKRIFTVFAYRKFGIFIFILSIFGGLIVSLKFAALLAIYQFLAWTYSAKPFRLKKFVLLGTFISALDSLIILFMGFTLLSGDQNIQGLSWRIILLLLISLTISLPIKDFKDIAGDRAEDIWTIPVLFGEELGRMIVASSIFISFMLSVFLLNEFKLFWWALFLGSAAFLSVTNKKIKPRQLFWWVLGCVFIFVIILGQTLFVK